jgi:hypothetical protein
MLKDAFVVVWLQRHYLTNSGFTDPGVRDAFKTSADLSLIIRYI